MDNSFFRFTDNFNDSKNLGNITVSTYDYDMQIHLSPNEAYSCITNVKNGISFGGLYKLYLVDCENNILADITDKVFIEEFTDDKTAKQQLRFEVINIELDFFTDLVRFRLDHNIVSGKKYWSNPFILSEYELDETVRFRFKNYIDLDGTNYRIGGIFQSVRLKCIKQKNNFISSGQAYTAFQGNKYSSRVIKTKMYEYILDMVNDFIYDRLQYLFTHDIIYVETIRVTDKQTFDNPDKQGDSNVAQIKIKLAIDETDVDNEALQVKEVPIPAPVLNADYLIGDYNSNDYKAT
jgi:hypothetical protein